MPTSRIRVSTADTNHQTAPGNERGYDVPFDWNSRAITIVGRRQPRWLMTNGMV